MSTESAGYLEQAALNRVWSYLILEELTRFGVQHVCIAPGSRSTPLTLEADAHPGLTLHSHFDERGLGFLALGMAKASQSPVAIIVTSGTAVANLLPAICESQLTGEPLVVLTADRPAELIDCGANQAISQLGIYSQHVTAQLNLPSPTVRISPAWLLSSIDNLMHQQKKKGGGIHINCPYPEPLYGEKSKELFDSYLSVISPWSESKKIYTRQLQDNLSNVETLIDIGNYKGIVIVGNVDLAEAEKAKELATQLGWPILCDPQSGISSDWQHYDLWLRNDLCQQKLAECELILQFGARLVSKQLNHFIKQQCLVSSCQYILLSSEERRLNPDHLPQTHIQTNITTWVNNQLNMLTQHKKTPWDDILSSSVIKIKSELAAYNQLTELSLAYCLPDIVAKHDLFIGNSLIVRLLDIASSLKGNRTYTNRGASGIDGLIATAVGVQRINQQAMLTVLGDTSLLYDLNSLSLLTHTHYPMVVLVTNNDGGAIFDLLPVPVEQKTALYQMPHGYQFKHIAKQFGLKYLLPQSMQELTGVVSEHLNSGEGALIVELATPPEQASTQLKTLIANTNAIH